MGAAVRSAADRSPSTGLAIREHPSEYVIVLDVSGFEHDELRLEAVGRELVVLGEHPSDDSPLHAHRRLEESFRIPDDADAERIGAVHEKDALEIHVRRGHIGRRTVPIERGYLGSSIPKGC